QVAGVSGPWYPGAAVMRHRSACWTALLVVAAGCPAQAQSPSPPDLVAPVRLVEAARQPELADLASYLEVRAAATKDDPERATVAARSLIERHPDSIWIGFARLDVGRVRRRTGDLAGARTWLQEAEDTLAEGDRAAGVATLHLAEVEYAAGNE